MLGAQSVGRAFPEYPTTIVHVNPPAIHLKDYISMAGPEVMTVGKSEAAQRTFRVSPCKHSHSLMLKFHRHSFQFLHHVYSLCCGVR